MAVNNYQINFNSYWGFYQVWHNEIGFCGEFSELENAIEYCKNG